MSIVLAVLSFCIVVAGAIFTFAFHGGQFDRTDFGVTLLVLGGLAFVLSAGRLWFIEQRDRRFWFRSVNPGFAALLSFCMAAAGAILIFAFHGGHFDRTAFGITVLLFGGLAFGLAASRLWFVDRRRRWQEGREYAAIHVGTVLLSFGLLVVGAVLTFAFRGDLAVGVILLLLGGLTFVLAGTQLWSVDHDRPRRPRTPWRTP
jgi:uncharacterized membrane protein YidH (DUF202 family)